MENIKQLTTEELVEKVKKNKTGEHFNELFKRCSKTLIAFLRSKNVSYDDSEDLLQDYFIKDFDKAISSFDVERQCSFIGYIKRILLLRAITYFNKKKKKQSVHLENMINETDFQSNLEEQNKFQIESDFIKEELRFFFRESFYEISNESHRNALLLLICIPFEVSVKELSELLGINRNTFASWTKRGIEELKSIVTKKSAEYDFDLNEIINLIKSENIFIDKEKINEIQDEKLRDILIDLIIKRKSFLEIKEKYNIDSKFQGRIFNFLSKTFSKKENFYRKEEIMEEKENMSIIDYYQNLKIDNENLRSNFTTGDEIVDKLLILMKLSFQKVPTLQEKFKAKILQESRSLKDIANELSLDVFEINEILYENSVIPENVKQKIYNYVKNFETDDEISSYKEEEILRNDEFNEKADEISDRLRKYYEEHKK